MPATWHALLPRLDRTVLREALQATPAVGASAQLAAVRAAAMQTLEAQAESLSDRFVHLHEMVKHDAEALSSLVQHVHTYLYPTGASLSLSPYTCAVGKGWG